MAEEDWLGFNAADLRRRIAQARANGALSAQPKSAKVSPPPTPEMSAPKHDRVRRLYSLPVFGHPIRIAASLWNLPKVVANAQRHFEMSRIELADLRSLALELEFKLAERQKDVEASRSHINRLHEQVAELEANLKKLGR